MAAGFSLTTDLSPAVPARWSRRLLRALIVWAALVLVLAVISEPTPENWTLTVSITLSGAYTLLLARTRRWWLDRLADRPLRNAMILGIVNAAVIETLFLVVERAFGAEGVAAHPNLLLDLLITMPWYTAMVIVFVRVQHRRRFTVPVVLLLGGVYELGADGLVGGAFEGTIFHPAAPLFLALFAYPTFIWVYSAMVLPPAWIVATTPAPDDPPATPAWRDALRPLVWLVPFALYLLALLVILGILSEVL